jgi:hypothetical protein
MSFLIRMLIAVFALSSLSLTWLSACGVTAMLGGMGNTLVSIVVAPESGSVTPGEAVQYIAQGKYRDGSTQNITASVVWSSTNPGSALVDGAGRATGVSAGATTIEASSGAVSDAAPLDVKGGTLTALATSPASIALNTGQQQKVNASGTYSDGTRKDLTAALHWTSTNPAAAVVGPAGVVRGVSAGTTTIVANTGELSAASAATVHGPELTSIQIKSAPDHLAVGATQPLVALGSYSNGATQDMTSAVTWSSSSISSATVSQAGVVAAVAPGAATIRATSGAVSGSALIAVAQTGKTSSGCDGAGNCYIRAAATGAGTGANWTDAFTGFGSSSGQVDPGAMQRGVTYWIANGEYGPQNFSTPTMGASIITIKGATPSSHGAAADWSATFWGQAVFGVGPSFISSDYWTFDGQTRGTDWQSGYTIKFDLNGMNYHGGAVNTRTPTGAASNLRFDYVEVRGSNTNYVHNSGNRTSCGGYCDSGFYTGSPTNNFYVGHSWVHDVGDTQFQSNMNSSGNSNGTNWIIEYNYISRDHTGEQAPSNHSEAFSSTAQNMTVRYNYFQDIVSSGVITDASGGVPDVGPWYIYGNIVFWTDDGPMNGTASGLGDGFVSMFGENMHGTSYIVGNTIANLGKQPYCEKQGTACAMYFLYIIGDDQGKPTWHIANNVVWNVQGRCVYGSAPGWTIHADYNSAFSSSFSNCGSHAENSGGNPFANWDGKGKQFMPWPKLDFSLAGDTKQGLDVFANLPPGCTPGVNCMNVAMDGTIYGANSSYNRGAMQRKPGTTPLQNGSREKKKR